MYVSGTLDYDEIISEKFILLVMELLLSSQLQTGKMEVAMMQAGPKQYRLKYMIIIV